ncbi:MAG: class I adenylate-forming enzyme family protein [Actinomycetales bacterium]
MSDWFLPRLAGFGSAEAVVHNGVTTTYDDLLRMVEEWRQLLDRHEVRPGEVVTCEGAHSARACAGVLALVERRAIVVPLDTLPAAKRAEFLDVGQVEVVIRVDDAGDHDVTRTGRAADHELYGRLREAGAAGLVLFSSGTTGRSKASVLNFDKALERYSELRTGKRILTFLNLDHIGGINTVLHSLSQGGTIVTVPERTPDAVFAAIERHRIEVLPTTPSFLNMVLVGAPYERYDTSSLELVTYGTEPMPERTLERLDQVMPGVRFKQTYGLSELGILPTRSRGNDTVWLQLADSAGFQHKIIDNVLWVRSEMAMLGYLNAPAPFDDEGYFNTQDVVEVDGDWIRILGRRSEIINVGGEKVYPSEVENVILQLDNVAEVSVSGKRSPILGTVVRATVSLVADEDPRRLDERVRAHCAGHLEPFKVPAVVEVTRDSQHSERFKKVRSRT